MAAQEAQFRKPAVSENTKGNRRELEKDLFSWSAPARPFKRRGRDFWVSVFAIAALIGFIFYIIEGIIPVILTISIVFLFYILSTVEPEKIEYKITTWGVKIAGNRVEWGNLIRFWFSERLGSSLLVFETFTLPGRLELVIEPKDEGALKKAISDYLPEEEAPPANLDKTANWLAKKLPGTQS